MSIRTTFLRINSFIFKFISVLPLAWIFSFYLFFLLQFLELGHSPIPYADDPASHNSDWFYSGIIILFVGTFYSILLGIISLAISFFTKRISRFHSRLFLVGIGLCLAQVIIDPGNAFNWFLD